MEASMRNTALTIFGALLISGLAMQMATASEHHRSKAYFGRDYDREVILRAYNRVNGPINRPTYVNSHVFDNPFSDRTDPSWIGDQDPSLKPAD
jgi:hypothetical protein